MDRTNVSKIKLLTCIVIHFLSKLTAHYFFKKESKYKIICLLLIACFFGAIISI